MFNSIAIKNLDAINVVAKNSAIDIKADFKNFFTLNFNHEDVESRLVAERRGDVGLTSRFSFFLKFLFLKVDLALYTNIMYFKDTVLVPLTLHLPKSSSNMCKIIAASYIAGTRC